MITRVATSPPRETARRRRRFAPLHEDHLPGWQDRAVWR